MLPLFLFFTIIPLFFPAHDTFGLNLEPFQRPF
jgi:hypothetical protein